MQIPDKRIKSIVKLFDDISKWNEYHPASPLPCGFVEKLMEDKQYLENKLPQEHSGYPNVFSAGTYSGPA